MRKQGVYLLFFTLLAACTMTQEMSRQNLASLYQPGSYFTELKTLVYHDNDSITSLMLRFDLQDFLYAGQENSPTPQARIRISAYLLSGYESTTVLDSAVTLLTDSSHYKQSYLITQDLKLKAKLPGEYLALLIIEDLNREIYIQEYKTLEKTDRHSQQFFMALTRDGEPLFEPLIPPDRSFQVRTGTINTGKILVRCYHREFPIAIPPFAIDPGESFDYTYDSIFEIPVKDHISDTLSLHKAGFYHFQADTSSKEGFTLFRFEEGFPAVTSPGQLLDPLRYITTQREFERLSSRKNIKLAVDSFWLANSGNPERARSKISRYYNHVQDANRLFTSYLEGWKTDRGMAYIVFGPPNSVYRDENTELWIYGEAGHTQSIRLSFVRVNNPFTYNDFSLYRNPLYKENWYNTVENWRR